MIVIDDAGHWQGARQATDEYLANNKIPLLLTRVDYTARIGGEDLISTALARQ